MFGFGRTGSPWKKKAGTPYEGHAVRDGRKVDVFKMPVDVQVGWSRTMVYLRAACLMQGNVTREFNLSAMMYRWGECGNFS